MKGDWIDHLIGDKWSFRIKLKGDKTIHALYKANATVKVLSAWRSEDGHKMKDRNILVIANFGLGTWHPIEGMFEVIKAMESLAKELE